ncbi:MAG: SGNH/GDSL hydrolase family protein [Phycisphaerae bacterium]|nr:SGNH/GDSL hydrolase family protein [Phycisphaerae bacterium]
MKRFFILMIMVLPMSLTSTGSADDEPKSDKSEKKTRDTVCSSMKQKPLMVPETLTKIQRVLIVGNSLTKHGPSTEKLGWPNNWGMAATAPQNDYAHQLYKKIRDVQKPAGREPELKIESMLAHAIKTRKELLEYKPDFVVLQMGDNLRPPRTNRKDFVDPFIRLVTALKQANPSAIIIIPSLWGRDAERNDLVKQVAEETGSIFVDLRPLSKDPKNSAGSEGNFKHPGVNWHPGNRGMKKIAEEIWTTTIQALNPPPAKKNNPSPTGGG